MKGLTGTWQLLRLALRRDRIKMPIWILAITAAMGANAPAVIDLVGESRAERVLYASTTAPSVVNRVFGGPIHGPEMGSIVMNETFIFTAIMVAFMSTLAIVRHTRQNEETGRSELIGAGIVGHHAAQTAALLLVIGANIILFGLLSGALIVAGLPKEGSIATGGAIAAIGITFGMIATITSHLSGTSWGANSLAGVSIAVVFVLRALGDSTGKIVNGGLGVESNWPSWLSPIGWGQQLYPFSENNWWVFGLFGASFVVLGVVSYAVNARRDLGMGIIPDKNGPAHAKAGLLSPLGLAWRLQKGIFRGWLIAMTLMGVVIGFISEEFKDLFTENPEFAEFLGEGSDKVGFSDFFFSAMMGFMAITLAGYATQSLLRLRSEESSGHLEPVLATKVSKPAWMMSHIAWTLVGSVVIFFVLGLATGVTYILITSGSWSELTDIVLASMVHLPAMLAFIGFVAFVFGFLPKAAVAVGWTAFALVYLMAQFGVILDLPQAVLNISPFAHTPAYPASDIITKPIVSLASAFVILLIGGIILFRRRDITTG